MNFYQLLEKRKSIRKFKKKAIDKKLIEKILAAGMQAPSGKNRQNWRFIVVTGEKRDEYLEYSKKTWLSIKDVLKEKLKPSLYEFTERFFCTLGDAPVIIFCYGQTSDTEIDTTSMGSVFMAVENINLAATYEGLGCCTMGAPLVIKEEVNKFLDIKNHPDKNLKLLCAVVMGYPDHDPPKAKRQIENRVLWY